VNRKPLLATFLVALAFLSTSCGTGDKLASISITANGASGGVINLAGLGATLQLHVNGNYTSGKIIDETNWATYTVTPEGIDNNTTNPLQPPPLTLTLNPTGMVTSVQPAVCTWVSSTGDPKNPGWAYDGDYKIVATFRGLQSNPIFIPVASAASAQTGMQGQCGPTS
jgi:hypothetical protein